MIDFAVVVTRGTDAMPDIRRITLFRIKNGEIFEDFLKGELSTYTHIEPNDEFEEYIKYDAMGGRSKN